MADGAPRQSSSQQLDKIIAGQARADQQLEEIFRRLGKAESVAGDARDTAREVVTILREQDTAARLAEMRAEMIQQVAALRQDVVAANGSFRKEVEALEVRIKALEDARNQVVGVASFFSWLSRVAPWLIAILAACVAALEIKK